LQASVSALQSELPLQLELSSNCKHAWQDPDPSQGPPGPLPDEIVDVVELACESLELVDAPGSSDTTLLPQAQSPAIAITKGRSAERTRILNSTSHAKRTRDDRES
jgi:hypothetical protein